MLEGFHLCHILFLSRAFLVLFGSMSVVFAKTQQACHLSASDSTEEEKVLSRHYGLFKISG